MVAASASTQWCWIADFEFWVWDNGLAIFWTKKEREGQEELRVKVVYTESPASVGTTQLLYTWCNNKKVCIHWNVMSWDHHCINHTNRVEYLDPEGRQTCPHLTDTMLVVVFRSHEEAVPLRFASEYERCKHFEGGGRNAYGRSLACWRCARTLPVFHDMFIESFSLFL